mmetsp:Transcript_30013/g.103290  ORF Transcript_30013/g.103290 Transcript_30013/m.103290 type:complete len:139 (-) Transcript_30013:18-434(-)
MYFDEGAVPRRAHFRTGAPSADSLGRFAPRDGGAAVGGSPPTPHRFDGAAWTDDAVAWTAESPSNDGAAWTAASPSAATHATDWRVLSLSISREIARELLMNAASSGLSAAITRERHTSRGLPVSASQSRAALRTFVG